VALAALALALIAIECPPPTEKQNVLYVWGNAIPVLGVKLKLG